MLSWLDTGVCGKEIVAAVGEENCGTARCTSIMSAPKAMMGVGCVFLCVFRALVPGPGVGA